MNQPAETISALDPFRFRCCQHSRYWPFFVGRVQVERAVWPVVAVVVDKDAEHLFEMAAVENKEPVEAFGSDGADEAFGDRVVCLRRSDRRAHDLDRFASEDGVEIVGEFAVAIVDEKARGSRSLA
jgi:hypothetical protein